MAGARTVSSGPAILRFALYHEGHTGGFKPALLLVTLLDGLVFLVALPIAELIDAADLGGVLLGLFRLS